MRHILSLMCIFTIANSLQIVVKNGDDKLNLALYYESFCPYCKQYFTSQIYPAWILLNDGFELKLVPYGKATTKYTDGKWEFTCQHGPKECYGNKVQGCIIKNKSMKDAIKLDLMNCILLDNRPDIALDKCADTLNITEKSIIDTCANGIEGDKILAGYGDETAALNPKLAHVPYNIFNGIYDAKNDEDARSNLIETICRLAVNKPSKCEKYIIDNNNID